MLKLPIIRHLPKNRVKVLLTFYGRGAIFVAMVLLCAVSCRVTRKPNYKYVDMGNYYKRVVWEWSGKDEPTKDILYKGDTLVTTKNSIFIIRITQKDTLTLSAYLETFK